MNTMRTTSPEIANFVQDLKFLFRPTDRSLFAAVRRTLIQYKLDGVYEPDDILSEACMRAMQYIRKHNLSIENPRAWLRTTSINIIKEKSRSIRKELSLKDINTEIIPDIPAVSDEVIDDNISAVIQALESLSQVDQLILTLRSLEGLSWEEVAYQLEQRGYGKLKEAVLRKRGQRAMKRLRIAFHKIRPFPSSV